MDWKHAVCIAVISFVGSSLGADDKLDVKAALERRLIEPQLPLREVQAYVESRVPPMPSPASREAWEKLADKMRRETLDKVVFRGEAAAWRDSTANVEWQETIAGGSGYRIKKLRYEVLPGLWAPAIVYEPESLAGKAPVALALSGHDVVGTAAKNKQMLCINLAKRGVIVLNLEWLFMGQLRHDDFAHYKMNQLDLCGTSGLAPFYLEMSKALDVLLAHPNADPQRVTVSGMSGGGWQTIMISSLDTRVTLANPVAGYSSIRTRARYTQDLGDSEQAPVDLAVIADYSPLTAMMAPRATLLTYNANDNCCFKAEHALPPLVEAARPVFALYGQSARLQTHVNHDPGDHNFDRDNREAYYRMIAEHFFTGQPFDPNEIACEDEIKTRDQLNVAMPADGNESFHSLAQKLAQKLPRDGALPVDKNSASDWRTRKVEHLRETTRSRRDIVQAIPESDRKDYADGSVKYWWLRVGGSWTVPAVELTRGKPVGTVIVIADKGRRAIPTDVAGQWLNRGYRLIALDPFFLGESTIAERGHLHALQVSCVGERPLGIQTGQIAAIARWTNEEFPDKKPLLVAIGPRVSLAALVAGALEPGSFAALELHESLGSLKQVIEDNLGFDKVPEYFCFGLLEHFDVLSMAALNTPTPIAFVQPSDRLKKEVAPLAGWHKLLGVANGPIFVPDSQSK